MNNSEQDILLKQVLGRNAELIDHDVKQRLKETTKLFNDVINEQKDIPPEFEKTFQKHRQNLLWKDTPEPINATRCIGCGGINISSKDKVKLFCNICLMLGRGYNE